MTHRLYYTNSYLAAFTSTVAAESDDRCRVYLDETAFYPTSGGQPHDLGTLGGVEVVDVVDEGERIAHVLREPLAARAQPVAGVIDWTRRFDHMQQHTGQHLLSAVFEDLFRYKTVSVHFGPDSSTLDLDAEMVTRDQIITVEERANAIVAEARAVNVSFEEAAHAAELRKASERSGTLRIVSIEGDLRAGALETQVSAQAIGQRGQPHGRVRVQPMSQHAIRDLTDDGEQRREHQRRDDGQPSTQRAHHGGASLST